jgi:hypothetical protein
MNKYTMKVVTSHGEELFDLTADDTFEAVIATVKLFKAACRRRGCWSRVLCVAVIREEALIP